jgi:hypothetical protein
MLGFLKTSCLQFMQLKFVYNEARKKPAKASGLAGIKSG